MVCYCCSCSSRTASLIVGTLFIVISGVYCAFLPFSILKVIRHTKLYDEELSDALIESEIFTKLIVSLVGSVFLLISSILLIVAAAKNNRRLLLPWIIIFSLELVAWIGNSLLTLFQLKFRKFYDRSTVFYYLAAFFALLALYTYCLKIVIEYFKELKENERKQENKTGDENSLSHYPSFSAMPRRSEKGSDLN